MLILRVTMSVIYLFIVLILIMENIFNEVRLPYLISIIIQHIII